MWISTVTLHVYIDLIDSKVLNEAAGDHPCHSLSSKMFSFVMDVVVAPCAIVANVFLDNICGSAWFLIPAVDHKKRKYVQLREEKIQWVWKCGKHVCVHVSIRN